MMMEMVLNEQKAKENNIDITKFSVFDKFIIIFFYNIYFLNYFINVID